MRGERDAAARTSDNLNQATPVRDDRGSRFEMAGCYDHREFLKGARIDCELSREPVKRIARALDLVAVQMTVEDREIDPASCVREAQLIDHEYVVSPLVATEVTTLQCDPDRVFTIWATAVQSNALLVLIC
tara:strand:- start:366 stop:758 length:393 start_codon:yes stop_codon:yes gene_type:complete